MKKILVIVMMLLMVASVMAASKSSHVNLVSKDSSWEAIEGPWGKLNYNVDFVFNGHGLEAGDEMTLLTYGGWSNVNCLGTSTVNEAGNIHIKGVAPEMLSDEPNIVFPKVWLVPSSAVNCNARSMLVWTPSAFVFEE